MNPDMKAMQMVIERDGASVISGRTDDLRTIRRCHVRGYTPENLVTVTLDETYRLRDDLALQRISRLRGWTVSRSADLQATLVRDYDGKYYRLDQFGNRQEMIVRDK